MPAANETLDYSKGPVITYALMAGLVFAAWTIMQNQFDSQSRALRGQSDAVMILVNEAKDDIKLLRTFSALNSNDVSGMKRQIEAVNGRLTENETSAFRRLDAVEQTRPTTGELKGMADGLARNVEVVNTRVTQLENRAFESATKGARTPVEAIEIVAVGKRIDGLQDQITLILADRLKAAVAGAK